MQRHYYNYLPFGEVSVSQNTTNYNNVYRFSAKQLDEEMPSILPTPKQKSNFVRKE